MREIIHWKTQKIIIQILRLVILEYIRSGKMVCKFVGNVAIILRTNV